MSKIKTVKSCVNPVAEGCIVADSKYMNGSTTGGAVGGTNTGWPALITNSGFSVKFRAHQQDCSFAYPMECGWMQIDVNGLKKPNIAGKDIFFVGIAKNKLVPFGADKWPSNPSTDCAASGKGESCSAKYLYE